MNRLCKYWKETYIIGRYGNFYIVIRNHWHFFSCSGWKLIEIGLSNKPVRGEYVFAILGIQLVFRYRSKIG